MSIRFAVALFLLVCAGSAFAVDVDFEQASIVMTEGEGVTILVRAEGLTGPLDVFLSYGFPSSHVSWARFETVSPGFPLAGFYSAPPNDKVYSDGNWGEAKLWFTDPATGKVVEKFTTIRVIDDEPAPTGSVDGNEVFRETTSDRVQTVIVRIAPASTLPVSIDLDAVDVTATEGVDYSLLQTTVNFRPMQTAAAVPVLIHGDDVEEGPESFQIVAAGGGSGSISIYEAAPRLEPDGANILSGEPPGLNLVLAGPLEEDGYATITTSGASILVIRDGVVIRSGDRIVPIDAIADGHGTSTVTVTFDPALGISPVSADVHVYDSAIAFAGADPLKLKPGETKEVVIEMTPAPPEELVLTLAVSAGGVVKSVPSVSMHDGTATVPVTALKLGTARLDLYTPGGRLVASKTIEVANPPRGRSRAVRH